MFFKEPQIREVAWAWALGWFLASVGSVISDVSSTPNRGLAAAYMLGLLGWTIGGAGTVRYIRQQFGADAKVVALSAIGWGVGALLAVQLGLAWQQEWNAGFWGPIFGAAIGGTIGGALTVSSSSFSADRRALYASLSSAFRWGAAFLVFQVLAFYAGYLLMQMTVDPLVPLVGHVAAKIPGWTLPAGAGGFLAARLASRLRQAQHA